MTETQKQLVEETLQKICFKLFCKNCKSIAVSYPLDIENQAMIRAELDHALSTATQQAVEEAAESERLLQSVVMQGTALALDHIECGKWLEATRRVKWIRNYIKAQQALSQK